MAWKLWKRLFGRSDKKEMEEAQAAGFGANTAALGFPLFPNSNREVIALQRLVGNQVVLQLIERRERQAIASLSRSEAKPEKRRRWWRGSFHSEKERG
jgi:hypothetical protein